MKETQLSLNLEYGKYDVCDTIHPKARWAYVKDLIPNTEE